MDNLEQCNQLHAGEEQGQVATFTSIASDATISTPLKVNPFLERVGRSGQVKEYMGNAARANAYEVMAKDAKKLPRMKLAAKYPHEYNSHRGAKRAPKSRGIAFDPRLNDFRNWLIHLGPRPAPEYTADRINVFEGYRPGNLRWACKVKQTENRRSTRWVKLPDGSTVKAKQLAVMAGKPYHTVRKQLERNWPVERILARASGDPLRDWQFPILSRDDLEPEYQNRNKRGQSRIDWLIEHFRGLEQLSTDAGHDPHAMHLRMKVETLKSERGRLKMKADDQLYRKVGRLLDGLTHKSARPSPFPNLPPSVPAEIHCKAVKVPIKPSEPKATKEQVLAMMQKLKL